MASLYLPSCSCRFGELLVRCVGQSEVDPDVTMRELLIATHESGSWRKVTHYQYHAWPDHGVPETTGPIRKLCRQLQSQKLTGCPIVHCSAGELGRSTPLSALCLGSFKICQAQVAVSEVHLLEFGG